MTAQLIPGAFWRAAGARQGSTGLRPALVHRLTRAGGSQVRLHALQPCGIDAVIALPA